MVPTKTVPAKNQKKGGLVRQGTLYFSHRVWKKRKKMWTPPTALLARLSGSFASKLTRLNNEVNTPIKVVLEWRGSWDFRLHWAITRSLLHGVIGGHMGGLGFHPHLMVRRQLSSSTEAPPHNFNWGTPHPPSEGDASVGLCRIWAPTPTRRSWRTPNSSSSPTVSRKTKWRAYTFTSPGSNEAVTPFPTGMLSEEAF